MWRHLQTMIWLRWRLMRNQWARAGTLAQIILCIALALAVGMIIGSPLIGASLGLTWLGRQPSQTQLLCWDVGVVFFAYVWVIGLMTQLQRSELLDVRKLLHLPVSLRQVFVVNYLASHVTVSLLVAVPGSIGLVLGMALGWGWHWLVMIPVVLGFVFMTTAWTYCFQGWLAALMTNPRRRRAILAGIAFSFMFLGQLPNLYFNLMGGTSRVGKEVEKRQSAVAAWVGSESFWRSMRLVHLALPPLWVGGTAGALANRAVWPALAASAGFLGLAGLGLRRAYRSTVRFYLGEERAGPVTQSAPSVGTKPSRSAAVPFKTGWMLPGLSNETSAVAWAAFQSLRRAPEVRMTLASGLVMLFVMSMVLYRESQLSIPVAAKPFLLLLTGMVAFFSVAVLIVNSFGYDREGFHTLLLSPMRRTHILLGHNLALVPVVLILIFVALGLAAWRLHMHVADLFAGLLQLLGAFLLVCAVGNFGSVRAPFRVGSRSLGRSKVPARALLLHILFQLVVPLSLLPAALPPLWAMLAELGGLAHRTWVNVIASAAFLACAIGFYAWLLPQAGGLLQQREQQVLRAVTEGAE